MSDQVLVAIITGLFGLGVTYIGVQAKGARNAADDAARFAEPTGNGFAKKVLAHLSDHTEKLDDTAGQLVEVRQELLELYKRDAIDHAHNRKTDDFIRLAELRLAFLERERT